MATKEHYTYQLSRQGLSPREIAQKLEMSLETTRTYLLLPVAEGRLFRTEVLLTIPAEERAAYNGLMVAARAQGIMEFWPLVHFVRGQGDNECCGTRTGHNGILAAGAFCEGTRG